MRPPLLISLIVLTAMLIGCQNKQPTTQPATGIADPSASVDPSVVDPADPNTAPPDDLELLVRKTEAHAHRVTDQMERTGTLNQAAGKTPPPSVLEWMDDSAYRIGKTSSPAALANASATNAPAADPRTLPAQPPDSVSTANTPVAIDDAPKPAPSAIALLTPPAAAPVAPNLAPSLERKLAEQVRDYPKDLAGQLDYQLHQFIQNKPAPDLATLATLPAEDQEIITAVVDGLTNFRSAVQSDPNLLLSRKVKPLIDMGRRLRARADLEVPIVDLCRRVDGFGVYEPIEPRFVAGQERDVIVYCEVENFMSQFSDKSQWETRLAEEVVLYTDADGLPILRDKATVINDLCRNRRNDFFIVRKLRLPANIPVGRYWLKVTVVDQLASRVAEHSIPLTFVAK